MSHCRHCSQRCRARPDHVIPTSWPLVHYAPPPEEYPEGEVPRSTWQDNYCPACAEGERIKALVMEAAFEEVQRWKGTRAAKQKEHWVYTTAVSILVAIIRLDSVDDEVSGDA